MIDGTAFRIPDCSKSRQEVAISTIGLPRQLKLVGRAEEWEMYQISVCTGMHHDTVPAPPRNHLRLEDELTILGTYTDGRLPSWTLSPPLTLPLISRLTSRSGVSTTRPAAPVEASERFTVYGHCTQTGPPPSRHQLPGIWTRALLATRSAATGEPSVYELCYTTGRAPIYSVHTFQVPYLLAVNTTTAAPCLARILVAS